MSVAGTEVESGIYSFISHTTLRSSESVKLTKTGAPEPLWASDHTGGDRHAEEASSTEGLRWSHT